MNTRLAALAAALAIATPAAAADYHVATADSETMQLYDASTIKRHGDQASVWVILLFAKPSLGATRTQSMVQADCVGDRTRIVLIRAYNDKGDLIGEITEPTDWDPAGPETAGDILIKAMCDGKTAMPLDLPIDEIEARYHRIAAEKTRQ